MIAAVITALFFALSALTGRRSITYLGTQRANLSRLALALFILGVWLFFHREVYNNAVFISLFFSGVIGFGLGDWALFEAYPRIGAALTVLLCQCLAAPVAAILEWCWLGTQITWLEVLSSAVILFGVALAVAPRKKIRISTSFRRVGVIYGILAACGQGAGAVISRFAAHQAEANGYTLDGISAAYQRLWGGLLTLAFILFVRLWIYRKSNPDSHFQPNWKLGWPWTLANALAGPAIGVSFYQWALQSSPSALVLPIVATTPLLVMFLAVWFEGVTPSFREILGGVIAVAGICAQIFLV